MLAPTLQHMLCSCLIHGPCLPMSRSSSESCVPLLLPSDMCLPALPSLPASKRNWHSFLSAGLDLALSSLICSPVPCPFPPHFWSDTQNVTHEIHLFSLLLPGQHKTCTQNLCGIWQCIHAPTDFLSSYAGLDWAHSHVWDLIAFCWGNFAFIISHPPAS